MDASLAQTIGRMGGGIGNRRDVFAPYPPTRRSTHLHPSGVGKDPILAEGGRQRQRGGCVQQGVDLHARGDW